MKIEMLGNETGVELVRALSLAIGPSGFEDEVRGLIYTCIKDLGADITVDKMGNLCALYHGTAPEDERKKVMISAHMDEVGFIINSIDKDGYLRLSAVGGIDDRVIPGKKVTFLGADGTHYNGIIATKAIHHKKRDERDQVTPLERMYADIGAKDDEDVKQYLSLGDVGTFDSEFCLFGENDAFVKSKALDDRMGCAAMIEIMRNIAESKLTFKNDVLFAFTVREETGLSGAGVLAHRYAPDYSIVIECTAVADLPDVADHKRIASLGDGGAVSIADRSTIYQKEMIDLAMNTAKNCGIKAQLKKYISGGNDAGHIHKSGAGVSVIAVSVPTRYLHSAACVAAWSDYEAVRDLVGELTNVLGNTKEGK